MPFAITDCVCVYVYVQSDVKEYVPTHIACAYIWEGRHSAASLAQSAARQSHNLKVVSSSLTGGNSFFKKYTL